MKILKKHKYKLLTLMLSIISIFTLFIGINKTYAYETDTFSYTISSITTTNNNLNIDNTNNVYTISNNSANNYIVDLFLNLSTNNSTENNITLLINYDILTSNDNITFTRKTINNTQTNSNSCKLSYNFYSNGTNNMGKDTYINNTNAFYISSKNYFSNAIMLNKVNATNISFDSISLNMGYSVFNSASYWKLIIYNVDIVDQTQIGLSQYYETYYGQIESNYNQLLSDYNDLQDNYDTLEVQYGDLQDDYDTLETNYNNLNSQIESLQNQITTLQNQKNTLEQQLEQINEEYYYIINQVAPFNPTNIQSTSVIFNNTNIDIPYNSFIIFDYFQIELDLMDFDILNTNDYRHLIQSINNQLTITLNLEKPIVIDNLEYWCHMRDFYNDYLDLTLMYNSDLVTEFTLMNNEHQDSQGNMAPYYISSGTQQINRLIFNFNLNDTFYNNYQGYIDYMVQSGTYTQGYNDGLNASNQYINKLKNEIEELNYDIDILDQQLLTLQVQYDDLNDRYNRVSNPNNTLYSMVVSIADVPLHVFKQIFNFDILGINISTFVLSLISLLIIIWLIKKII